jgi:hypothetical protein
MIRRRVFFLASAVSVLGLLGPEWRIIFDETQAVQCCDAVAAALRGDGGDVGAELLGV